MEALNNQCARVKKLLPAGKQENDVIIIIITVTYVAWDVWTGREEMGVSGGRKKIPAFEEWQQRRERVTYDRYWAQKAVVKRAG